MFQVYTFAAEDLEDRGYIGEGNFGTVSNMYFVTAGLEMAVKVQQEKVCERVSE